MQSEVEMQSEVKSSLETKIFRPTIAEFQNFAQYIKKLEHMNLSFAKVSIRFILVYCWCKIVNI